MNQKPTDSVIARSPSGVSVLSFTDETAARRYVEKLQSDGKTVPNLKFYHQVVTETEIQL